MGKNNKRLVRWLLLNGLLMAMLPFLTGCSSSDSSYAAVGAASYDATEGTTIAVAVYQGNATVPDATVSVNGRVLSYGFPVTYQNTTNTIPARQGDVLVIGERHVDTIWGPTFNY